MQGINKCFLFPFALRHHSTTQMQPALRKVEASAVLSLQSLPPFHIPLLCRLDVTDNRSISHPMRAPTPPAGPPSTTPHTAATCRSCCSPTLAPNRTPCPSIDNRPLHSTQSHPPLANGVARTPHSSRSLASATPITTIRGDHLRADSINLHSRRTSANA